MTTLEKQLRKIAYVRKGSGSTEGMTVVITKNRTDENVEATDALIRAIYPVVNRSSFGTYLVR